MIAGRGADDEGENTKATCTKGVIRLETGPIGSVTKEEGDDQGDGVDGYSHDCGLQHGIKSDARYPHCAFDPL